MRARPWSRSSAFLTGIAAFLTLSAAATCGATPPTSPEVLSSRLSALESRLAANETGKKLGFKQAKDWEVTYVGAASSPVPPQMDDPKVPVTISFLAPDRMAATQKGKDGYVACADSDSIRVLFPSRHFGLWVPAGGDFTLLPGLNLTFGGPEGPLARAWGSLDCAGNGLNDEYSRLHNESVAGRECLVLKEVIPEPSGRVKDWTMTQWFDREYGLPLKWRSVWGRDRSEVRATSVKINTGIKADRFTLKWPAALPVFRGRLDFTDVSAIEDFLAGTSYTGAPDESFGPDTHVKTFLRPGALPLGFSGPFGMSSASGTGPDDADEWWSLSRKWFSKTGGVIIFTQGTGFLSDLDSSEPTGTTHSVTVRKQPGDMLVYHLPFDGLVLTWKEGDMKCRLEGTGVSEEDLVKMADGMKKWTVNVSQSEE